MTSINNPLLIRPKSELPEWVGIVGAGTIGPDIGYYLKSAIPGLHLVLVDINPAAIDRALERIRGYAAKGLQRGKLSPVQADDVQQALMGSTDYEALAYCDWVIEAATENLELKRGIFSRIESIVRGSALITSNTSSLPAARLFSHLERPERTTVTHFFAPAYRNPAVEVVQWDQCDPDIINYLRWLFCVTDKVPMLTQDVVCFMLDRIFDNWCNEAALLLDEATPAQVDTVAGEFAAAGPFCVLNLANGNPIIVETNTLQMGEGAHYRPADIFRSAGRWDTIKPGERVEVPLQLAARIRDRLLGVLFSQSADILNRGIGSAADLDLGCRLAFGFRLGPLELMRSLGEAEVSRILAGFAEDRPGMPMPQRPLADYQKFQRHVVLDDVDGVRIITVRRPDALNALHDELTDEILEVMRGSEDDPRVRGFIITGYGTRAFSAGADIGRFPAMLGDREQSAAYARACSRLLLYLDECAKPVVAALNGMALGGGLELAMRCHSIVATGNAWMQFPEITLGIVPGIGAMVVPYRRWPQASAAFHSMLTRADRLSAEQACELGIVDTLVDDHANLIPAALWRINDLQENRHRIPEGPVRIGPLVIEVNAPVSTSGQRLSPHVLDIMRHAIEGAARAGTLAEALEIGYQAFGESACTAAALEGISAFGERRRPDFAKTG